MLKYIFSLLLMSFAFSPGLPPQDALSREKQQFNIADPSQQITTSTPKPRRNIGRFFDKLRAGRPVTVAYIGGAVTSGLGASNSEKTSCRALVTAWLRQ